MWKNQSLRIAFTLPTEGKAISQYWNGLLIVELSKAILKVFFKTFYFLHFEAYKKHLKNVKKEILYKKWCDFGENLTIF